MLVNIFTDRWRVFSNTTRQFSNSQVDEDWVSYNLTQFWRFLPGGSVRSHRLRAQLRLPPLQLPIASPGCHCCSWLTGCKSEVPMTPSSGLIIVRTAQSNIHLCLPGYYYGYYYFLKDFIYFSEREGREKVKEMNIDPFLSHSPTGDVVCNPGMCPDRDSFGSHSSVLNLLSHTSQGKDVIF